MNKKLLSVLLALVLALSLCLVTAAPVAAVTPGTPTIDGVVDTDEWDGATVIDVAGGMGTVSVIAETDYLYVLVDVLDSDDARLGQTFGNDQTSININPTAGVPWGTPCDIIFQMGADPDAWGGASSGQTDDWETDWEIDGVQQMSLPEGLETTTLYDGTTRISEWKLPLASIAPSQGDTLRVAGAIDVGVQVSYVYPVDLEWIDASTYAEYSLMVENETTGLYYQTIQAAINAAVSGDTVNVAAGTYEEAVTIDKNLTLEGEDRGTTEIKFGYGSYPSTSPLTISADEVTVSGFTIRSGPDIEPAWTIVVEGDSALLTDLNVIKEPLLTYNDQPRIGGSAFWLAPDLEGFTFTDSIVESEWNGIKAEQESKDITVRNVDFTYPGEWAIMLKMVTGAEIEENTFICTGHADSSADSQGIVISRGSTAIEIRKNQFIGSSQPVFARSHIGILLQNFKTGPVGVSILGNDISDFDRGIKVEADVETSRIHINYNSITGDTYSVENLALTTVDATLNWWGHASGPQPSGTYESYGGKVSANVDYNPWLLEEGGATFDKTLALKDGWTLVSTDKAVVEEELDRDWVGMRLAYKYTYQIVDDVLTGGFIPAALADLEPLTAIYVKTDGGGGVGFNYAEVGAPAMLTKELEAGWNLISISSKVAGTDDILSPLRYVTVGTQQVIGLTTLVSQGEYNQFSGDFYLATLTEDDWSELETLIPFDGYWANMEAADTFEVIPQ